MTERDMQTLFGKFIQKHPPKETEAYELKISKTPSFSFSNIKEHQIEALLKTESGFLYHRLTDQPWMDRPYSYTLRKPFDCFCLVKNKAYLIFWFYKPRKPKKFIKIEIKKFINFMNNSSKKSFREEEIASIADVILEI